MEENIAPWRNEWEEIKEIDRGGQGIITELRHKINSTRRAVLKRIVPRWQKDPQARQRLQQETETLLKLNDLGAHVPTIYDSFLNHNNADPFLLMEFIVGIRFDNWLKNSAPVAPVKAVLITCGIAEIISLCHQCKIGHRDLKPSNIILKNGEVNSPYVLDFGIAFDSKQTMILTHEGEMFWNEFIILPECQDLQGGHRDLRSDITALAGIFFNCLTGRPPIMLRDAQERAPHKRCEDLLLKSAETVEQGERLIWLFDRAFAYRIVDRFQTLNEFKTELMRFGESSNEETLDLLEQFKILDQDVRSRDRNVQLVFLRQKYDKVLQEVKKQLHSELRSLEQFSGKSMLTQIMIGSLTEQNRPKLDGGDLLNIEFVDACIVERQHFRRVAVVLLAAFGVGMQIYLFSSSYCTNSNQHNKPDKILDWSKIAVIDENSDGLSVPKISVIIKALRSNLARETRNLIRRESIKGGGTGNSGIPGEFRGRHTE